MEDVLVYMRYFLDEFSTTHDKSIEGLTPQALRILLAYDFPGNVRELKNIIEHGFVLSRGPLIDVEHLPDWLTESNQAKTAVETLRDCEKRLLWTTLERHNWNRVAAARALGIHKATLFRRIRHLDIHPPRRV